MDQPTVNTDINFDALLLELALEHKRVEQRNAVAREMRARMYEAYVKAYDDEIAANETRLAEMEKRLKTDTLAYVAETGDLTPHPKLTFRRTTKLVYDKETMLRLAEDRGALNLIRVKKELNVREFEHQWRNGHLPWAEVEEVNDPTIALSKLGDLLIEAEVRAAEVNP